MDWWDAFFEATAGRGSLSSLTPSGLAGLWESVVAECEAGYSSGLAEYWNDLVVRSVVEDVVTTPRLRDDPGLVWFFTEVAQVDARFAALVAGRPPSGRSDPWWQRRLPPDAGAELVEDAAGVLGIELRVVGDG